MGIVIIGAGLAGATAATELRARGYDGELTLVGAEPHLPYERPPLSKGYLLGDDPDIALAEAAGLRIASREQGGGVAVDAALRASDPAILAIGDIANHDHPSLGRIRVEHWEAAIEQGKAAARTLGGDETVYDRQPYFFTDQYDLGMEFVGHIGAAGYDRVDIEGSTDAAAGDACRVTWVRDGLVIAAMHLNDWDASETIRQQLGSAR